MRSVHLVFTVFISCSVQQEDPCITSTDTSLTCTSFRKSLRNQLNISHKMVQLINVSRSSNCFAVIKSRKNWEDAQKSCKHASSRLAWVSHSNGSVDYGLMKELFLGIPEYHFAWIGLRKVEIRETLHWDCPYNTGKDFVTRRKIDFPWNSACLAINRAFRDILYDSKCSVPIKGYFCELVLPLPSSTTPSTLPNYKFSSTPSQKSSTMVITSSPLLHTDSSTDGSTADPAKVGSKLILYIALGVTGLVFFILAPLLIVLIFKGKREERRLQLELLIKPRGPSGPVNVHSYFSTSTSASSTEYEAPESSYETVMDGLDEDSGSSREN